MLTEIQKQEIKKLRDLNIGYKTIAQKLGVSVGQVRHECSHQPKVVCLQCSQPIKQDPHRKEKKFCSDKCRITWWNHHKKIDRNPPKHTQVCEYCHQEFHCYKSKDSKYCSRKCYADARRKG